MTGCEIIHCKYWFNSREANGVCTYDGPCIYGTPREGELQAANAELNVKLAEAIIDYVTQVTREEAYDELIAQAADTLHQVCAQIEKKSDLLAGYIEVTTAGDAAAGLRVFMLKGEREGGEK